MIEIFLPSSRFQSDRQPTITIIIKFWNIKKQPISF